MMIARRLLFASGKNSARAAYSAITRAQSRVAPPNPGPNTEHSEHVVVASSRPSLYEIFAGKKAGAGPVESSGKLLHMLTLESPSSF
ncbi:unnamed protein product [Cuscuta campestris]|uniref:Uncharacterized protein n=1 Tax=Cuscuta campestris TaxID=132261 RepID=A0A484M6W9_9ASTE|nr:unnamed protein product [Cuscuta campestris]